MSNLPLLRNSRQWIWPQSYWRESESAWLTAHKFGFLNSISGHLLGRVLAGTDKMPAQVPQHLFRRIAQARQLGVRPDAEHDALRTYTLDEIFGVHKADFVSEWIRFCPKCIRRWYHASIFQLVGLARCPVHGLALRSGCPNCGHRLREEFLAADFARPLHCPKCLAPLGGSIPGFSDVFGMNASDYRPALQMKTLQRRIAETCRATSIYPHRWDKNYSDSDAGSLRVLLAGTGVLSKLDGYIGGGSPRLETHKTSMSPYVQNAKDKFLANMQEVRAIGRYLARRVRAHCGHSRAPHLLVECWALPWEAAGYVLLWTDSADYVVRNSRKGVCGCCAALVRWRTSFAAIFYAGEYAKRHGPELGVEEEYLVDAQVALDYFSICAVQIASMLELTLPAADRSEHQGFRSGTEALRIWPPAYRSVAQRVTSVSNECAAYSQASVSEVLERLATTSILAVPARCTETFGTERGIWGQSIARRKMRSELRVASSFVHSNLETTLSLLGEGRF